MEFASINWLAVVVCVIVSLIIGSVWFSEKVFYPPWLKALNKAQGAAPDTGSGAMVKTFGLTILASFVQAIFMALMVNAMGSMTPGGATLTSGAMAGFMLWLGFVAPSSLTNRVFAGQLKAWLYEAGNHLVTYLAFGAILGAWH